MNSKFTFIDKNFYVVAGPPARPGGDPGADQSRPQTPPLIKKNPETSTAPTMANEIYNSPIDSQIDSIIKSLTNINRSLKNFKISAVQQMSSTINKVEEVNSDTPISNIGEGGLLYVNGPPNDLIKTLWEELPKIRQIIDTPSFISYFNMSEDGKAFLTDLKNKVNILFDNFGKPVTKEEIARNRLTGTMTKFMGKAAGDNVQKKKDEMNKAIASLGSDFGENKISVLLGNVYTEQKQFLKDVQSIVDTFGNLADESHLGYHAFRNNKGKMNVEIENPENKKKITKSVDKSFVDERTDIINKFPTGAAKQLLAKISKLHPQTSVDDAMDFVLMTDFASAIASGEDAKDPISGKKLKSENINVITNDLMKYFRNEKSIVETFVSIISNFELYDPEIKDVKKAYVIRGKDGQPEAKIKLDYYSGDEGSIKNKISGTYIHDGKEIDLGDQLLDDFLDEKSIKDSLFISKIIGGDTKYVLEIYNFLVFEYIKRNGITQLNKFKNSTLWDSLQKAFIENHKKSVEYEDPMQRTTSMKLEFFKSHPKVLGIRRAAEEASTSTWEDLIRDPNSNLNKEIVQLKNDLSSLADIKDAIDLGDTDPNTKSQYSALEAKIAESKKRITNEFPGIKLSQVLSPTFNPENLPSENETQPKKITLKRNTDADLENIEKIKQLYPKYRVEKHNLEIEQLMLDPESPERSNVANKIADLDQKLTQMLSMINQYVRSGVLDRDDVASEIYGKISSIPKAKLDKSTIEKVKLELRKLMDEYDELSLTYDQATGTERDSIKKQMDEKNSKINYLNNLIRLDIKLGGELPGEEMAYDAYSAMKKTIKMVQKNNSYPNEELAAAHFYLINDAQAKENTERAIRNINELDSLRRYLRVNYPQFLGTKEEPGILQKAKASLAARGINTDEIKD